MDGRIYYTAPTDEIFEEVVEAAKKIWMTYDDTHGYATDKVQTIDSMDNVDNGNFMAIIGMFDTGNQFSLSNELSADAREAIRERMIAGGFEPQYIPF